METLGVIRIMIIDDHPVVRAAASMLSTQPGIDVVASASSGAEALTLLGRVSPDVILMDCACLA
jgi:DNA-binding NarL/FixJ family response regulator